MILERPHLGQLDHLVARRRADDRCPGEAVAAVLAGGRAMLHDRVDAPRGPQSALMSRVPLLAPRLRVLFFLEGRTVPGGSLKGGREEFVELPRSRASSSRIRTPWCWMSAV